jgi:hypothetical protein
MVPILAIIRSQGEPVNGIGLRHYWSFRLRVDLWARPYELRNYSRDGIPLPSLRILGKLGLKL